MPASLRKVAEHPVDVVRLDPALEEPGRDGEAGDAAGDFLQFEPGEPAREHVLAEFRPQAALHPLPGSRDLGGGHIAAVVTVAATAGPTPSASCRPHA